MRLSILVLFLVAGLAATARGEVTLKKTDTGVEVAIDGKPFTTYIFNSGFKPILWPVLGPTGKEMTRAWPLRKDNPMEATDHVHQKSFWFDHGNVNGFDFWAETLATSAKQGKQVHTELVKAEGGKIGTLVTKTDWVGPDGGKICTDVRTLRFGGDSDSRWIDFDVVVTAAADEVTFGDTKEGSFGLRIAESMRVDKGGNVMTSEGLGNSANKKDPLPGWGKPAAWVDCNGPVEGEHLGIAILNHPSSFRYPTHWHVRAYGLFAANPWGLGDFKQTPIEHKLKKGESFTLRYRVIFHKGDEKAGKIAEAFAAYAKE